MEVIDSPKQSELKSNMDVIWHPHPVTPVEGRKNISCAVRPGTSVRQILIASGIDIHQPIVIILDDRMLTVDEWDTVCPTEKQIINVQATVMGGGGGGGGSNALQIVAMIAIVVVAVLTYQYELLPAAFGMSAATVSAIGAGVIMTAGSMIVNSVFSARVPGIDNNYSSSTGQYSGGSPTYSLSGGTNQTRPYESMPVVMGAMRWKPDLAVKPYVEYHGSDQYLYQIFHLGISSLANSDWQISTNPIADYTDYTWYPQDSSGKIAAFPGNVDSIQGAALENSAGWIVRTTSDNTYKIGVDIEGTMYYANDSGGLDYTEVELQVQYRPYGTSTWLSPSVIYCSGSGFASGHWENYSVWVSSGDWGWYEGWQYDEWGSSYWGWNYGWIDTSHYETRTRYVTGTGNVVHVGGATQSPLRSTLFFDVPVGRYDVRVYRATADTTNSRLANKTNWSTLRSYQLDSATYVGQNRLGLAIRASEQLNGVIQQLSVYSQASAYYYNGSAWVWGITSNPAHWFMDFAIGRRSVDGKLLYGVGLSADQIDLAGLSAWATFCSNEGLTFNAVIDGNQTAADILNAIARCGFASTTWASGKIGAVWDGRNQSPVAAFGMSNIARGSFQLSYITEQLAEEIIVQYTDPAKNYESNEVRVKVPGITTPARSSTINLFGCTSQTMAGKFANYIAAQQYYRKRRIQWETDFEGFVCQRGDVVILSHDLAQWGYSGRVVSVSGNTLTLDRTVPHSGAIDYLMLKRPDGTMTTYTVSAESGEDDTVTLTSTPSFQDGMQLMDHVWFFSPLPTPGKKVKILSVQPVSETRLQIIATDESPEFYAAWDGTWNTPVASTLLTAPQTPVIENLKFSEQLALLGTGRIVTRVTISWSQRPSQVEKVNVTYKFNGGSPVTVVANGSDSVVVDLDGYGTISATAVPVNQDRVGSQITGSANLYGKTLPPSNVSGFTTVLDQNIGVTLNWTPVPDIDIDHYEIRLGSSWATAAYVANVKGTSLKIGLLPVGSQTWLIKAVDTSGNYSTGYATTSLTIASPSAPTVSGVYSGPNLVLSWNAVSGSLATQSYEVRYGSSWGSAVSLGTIKGTTFSVKANWSGARSYWVAAIDLNGNYGSAGQYVATVNYPATVTPTQQVIDNNVLLRWNDATTTLPIDHYEVRKGSSWSSGTVIGTVSAIFTFVFETTNGSYTYWIAGVDAAGNYGTPSPVTALVNDPPDYQLQYDYNSTLNGSLHNLLLTNGSILGPYDTTQTWQSHFSSRSWSSPQDQVSAGYPVYIEPMAASGYYEETVDYGTILAATRITATLTRTVVAGSPVVTPTISVKAHAGDAWIDYSGLSSVYVTNFRYVKIRYDITSSSGTDIVSISGINIRFDVKLVNDAGIVAASSSDSTGTTVYFNKSFVDVNSITVTPQGTTARYAIYDFVDAPNPTYFKVYVFDNSGNRVSCNVSWSAKGV